jgi:hypothetical protein
MSMNFDEAQKLSQKNIETTMATFGAVSNRAQAIGAEMADFSKRSIENGNKAMEKMLAVKSFDKALEVQGEYMKTAFADCMAGMSKFGELYAKLAEEAFKPFADQVAKAKSSK